MNPKALTSLKATVYVSLVKGGGGSGRNCSARTRVKGVTAGQCVNTGGGKLGGVTWYSPGSVPGTKGRGCASDPSLLRSARMRSATRCPTWKTRRVYGQSGMSASDAS